MPRLAAAVVVLAIVTAPGLAWAQFAVSAIEFYDPDASPDRLLTEQDIKNKYFSKANCECAKSIRLRLRITQDRSSPDRFAVVAGSGTCLNTTDGSILTDTCRILKEGRISEQDQDIEITTQSDGISVATLMVDNCDKDRELNVYVFTGQDTTWTSSFSTTFTADGIPPTPPKANGDPVGGENLVRVSFTTGATTQTDVRYQILCEIANTRAPGLKHPPEPGYGRCLAPAPPSADGGASNGEGDAGAGDGGNAADAHAKSEGSANTGITGLDPSYVCSETLQADGSTTISGLENQVTYRFYVVAFDLHGNATRPILLGEATPVLSEDLWERYKRSGGKAEGGYCSTAGPLGAGWLALSLLGLALLVRLGSRRGGQR
ncbi:MAG: hypothetical protein CSA65_05755 [Proteobacteria bacterium]|nr:MAG: hypothetical protein CSB49_02085 [Pseudomonadota bacterium]PIE18222.1 MAG: hypothetical protein CSA65_05755 [Pseudomonadota bacterium]